MYISQTDVIRNFKIYNYLRLIMTNTYAHLYFCTLLHYAVHDIMCWINTSLWDFEINTNAP